MHADTRITISNLSKIEVSDNKWDRNQGRVQAYQSETLQNDEVIDKDEAKWHAQPRTVGQTLSRINTCRKYHTSLLTVTGWLRIGFTCHSTQQKINVSLETFFPANLLA